MSWTFDIPPPTTAQCAQTSPTAVSYGNNITCNTTTGGVPTVKATGWANTGQTSGATAGGTSTNNTLESGYVSIYPNSTSTSTTPTGIGMINRESTASGGFDPGEGSSPEHAMDNGSTNATNTTISQSNAIYDIVLMEFSSAVALTSLNVGWASTDSDMTILACTNSAATCLDFTTSSKNYSDLATMGWDYVEHSAASGASTGVRVINSATNSTTASASSVSSRYWLIGAYNPTVGTADVLSKATNFTGTASSMLTVGQDHVKLLGMSAVVTNPPGPGGNLPEPAMLSLVGVAAAGAWFARKRSSSSKRKA